MPELSHDHSDDGFHEIQLSGKQLVFLFMATTVVSVVIFLCGVLVGRGVRAEAMAAPTPDQPSPATASTAAVQSPATPVTAPPPAPTPEGELSYPDRLQRDKPPAETLKPQASAPEPPAAAPPAPAPAAESSAPPSPASAAATATGGGSKQGNWVVQIVSLRDRAAAMVIVDRLTGRGYPAFLVNPVPGAPVQSYKVQVGRYVDRHEAELVAGRLKKEEQFEPWVLFR